MVKFTKRKAVYLLGFVIGALTIYGIVPMPGYQYRFEAGNVFKTYNFSLFWLAD